MLAKTLFLSTTKQTQSKIPHLLRLNLLSNHIAALRTGICPPAQARKFSVQAKSLSENSFSAGVCVCPHAMKKHKGGEDAYVLQEQFLAVADGVGGWAESGVDPAVFSRTLC